MTPEKLLAETLRSDRPALALFCSPRIAPKLKDLFVAAKSEAEADLSRALGTPIYFDPDMPETAFDVGYDPEAISARLTRIRARAATL
jgi:hypothetical protein